MHRILIVLAAVFILLTNFSVAALAQTSNCSAVLVDDAGVLGNRLNDVRTAAETIQNRSQGTVRILLAKDTGQNAKAYRENQLEKQCPRDWGDGSNQTGPTHVRNDLLSIIIGMNDQKDDVYAGPKFTQKLSAASVDDIRTKTLEAALGKFAQSGKKDNNVLAQGLIDSMGRMQTAVAVSAPAPAAAAQPAPAAQATPSKPADLTWLWIILGVLVVAGILFFAINYFRKARREDEQEAERKQSVQQAVQSAKLTAVRNVTGLDSRSTALKSRAAALQNKIPAEVYQRLQRKVKAASEKSDDVALNFGNLNDNALASASDWNGLNGDALMANRLLKDAEDACETLENDPSALLASSTPTVTTTATAVPTTDAWRPTVVTSAPIPTSTPVQPSASNYNSERREAKELYDEARQQTIRAERYILENSRYITQSAWSDLDDAREELSKSDRASTAHSMHDHARKARNAAQEAMSSAERDVRNRRDYTRERWYYDRYHSGYTPYGDNSTLVIYEPVYMPQHDTVYVRDSGPSYSETSSRGGSDSSGSWGNNTSSGSWSQGNDSSGSWDTSSGSSGGNDSSGSWDSGSSGSSGSDSSGGGDSGGGGDGGSGE